ncbi:MULTISPECIES: TIR domain-containing protein [Lactobacillaceae]|uniref:TIR domain-containing protein n=1 Tax=Pediococcus damnosus TaxID=51663 RepID=A0AAC9FJV3_9LACO|nr:MULTISPECIES: TIR domain-containing protein [Lactobacillaceae]AMV63900.1 Hypothetical protein ADU70_0071 [Pediococcus damnosus]MCT4461240.1 TIR domain-containing protein [Lactiplantibacillus plantarum]
MILNQKFLRNISENMEYEVRKSIDENFNHINEYDIFISHSFLDKSLIQALALLFKKDGFSVYIDWIQDSYLDRSHVSPKTAKIIKNRISQCKALAYVSTENVSNSKWCPWELGIGDGIHKGKACILPILEENGKDFKGQEYLGLYPYMDYTAEENSETKHFWITDPQNTNKYTLLKDWLDGKDLKLHN